MSNTDFFDDKFDYKQYIEERLADVPEEERRNVHQVMKQMLLPFYEQVEQAYGRLSDRILIKDGSWCQRKQYQYVTTLMNRAELECYEESFAPMCVEDLEWIDYHMNAINQVEAEQTERKIAQIYIHDTQENMKYIDDINQLFQGNATTQFGSYSVWVRLKKVHRYDKEIQKMYQLLEQNGIPFSTLNIPYIFRMYDVYIVKSLVPEDEEILELSIDYEEFQDKVYLGYFPVWNVTRTEKMTTMYPVLDQDQIQYMHLIAKNKLSDEEDYLIANYEGLQTVDRNMEGLMIHVKEARPKKWELVVIHQIQKYPSTGFRYCWNAGVCSYGQTQTIAGARKMNLLLGYHDRVKVKDIKIGPSVRKKMYFDMNRALDQFLIKGKEGPLQIVFKSEIKEEIELEDTISYLLSCYSLIYSNFQIEGIVE